MGASLIAFVIVYFAVFGTGTWYLLRLMGAAPRVHELGVRRTEKGPVRSGGITPGPARRVGGPVSAGEEE